MGLVLLENLEPRSTTSRSPAAWLRPAEGESFPGGPSGSSQPSAGARRVSADGHDQLAVPDPVPRPREMASQHRVKPQSSGVACN